MIFFDSLALKHSHVRNIEYIFYSLFETKGKMWQKGPFRWVDAQGWQSRVPLLSQGLLSPFSRRGGEVLFMAIILARGVYWFRSSFSFLEATSSPLIIAPGLRRRRRRDNAR